MGLALRGGTAWEGWRDHEGARENCCAEAEPVGHCWKQVRGWSAVSLSLPYRYGLSSLWLQRIHSLDFRKTCCASLCWGGDLLCIQESPELWMSAAHISREGCYCTWRQNISMAKSYNKACEVEGSYRIWDLIPSSSEIQRAFAAQINLPSGQGSSKRCFVSCKAEMFSLLASAQSITTFKMPRC